MNEVRLKDFVRYLEPGIPYGIRPNAGTTGIEIYHLSEFGIGKPIATLTYSYDEWLQFLAKHHCNMNGDYKFPGCVSRRNYHSEKEDGISFLIACGKDAIDNCGCDWIIIE